MLGLFRCLPRSSRKVAGVTRKASLLRQQVRRNSVSTIAIDFGYTSSQVAVLEGTAPKVIENIEGERSTPSFVVIHPEGNLVGITARKQALVNPKSTFYNIKAVIGQKYSQEFVDAAKLRYGTVSGEGDYVHFIDEGGKTYSSAQVTSFVLHRMKETAENNLGAQVQTAVIGVPAYFSDVEMGVIKEAATLVGLEATITPEPIAAVLAHKIDRQATKNYFVYDFGGTRLDLSIVSLSNGMLRITETVSIPTIGGEIFTSELVEYVLQTFQDETGIDLRGPTHTAAIQKLLNASEVAKCELSTSLLNEINLPFIAANESGPQNLIVKVSRAKLEAILQDSVLAAIEPVRVMLEEKKINAQDLELIIVGGQSKMPKVVEDLEAFFGKKSIKDNTISPDEAVVLGLHLYTPQAATEEEQAETLTEVPCDIGVEILGGKMEVIVPRSSPLPFTEKKIFTTTSHNQQEIEIKVFQGNHMFVASNLPLGRISLAEFPNTLQGELRVELTINVDSSGTITVAAKELATKKEDKFTVRSFGGLTRTMATGLELEAEKMKREETNALKTTHKAYMDAFNEIKRLRMVITGCQSILDAADLDALLKRLESAQTEVEARNIPDTKPIKDLFEKKLLEKLN